MAKNQKNVSPAPAPAPAVEPETLSVVTPTRLPEELKPFAKQLSEQFNLDFRGKGRMGGIWCDQRDIPAMQKAAEAFAASLPPKRQRQEKQFCQLAKSGVVTIGWRPGDDENLVGNPSRESGFAVSGFTVQLKEEAIQFLKRDAGKTVAERLANDLEKYFRNLLKEVAADWAASVEEAVKEIEAIPMPEPKKRGRVAGTKIDTAGLKRLRANILTYNAQAPWANLPECNAAMFSKFENDYPLHAQYIREGNLSMLSIRELARQKSLAA